MENYEQKIREIDQKLRDVAETIADKDPARPAYHFHAPSQWMDDPNGIIYHDGYYHMMYSLNPDTDQFRAGMVYKTGSSRWSPDDPDWTGGITVWGHARSRDLIHWEHLPVAIYPDQKRDEHYIWFGCTAINDEGVPVAIYTSIGYRRNPTDSAEQWIWFGDNDLLKWRPGGEKNPILTEELHHDVKFWEWRDPFLFRNEGRAYLILGAKQDAADGGKAVVLLYVALDRAFTQWEYKGILFSYPDPKLRSIECPNLVKIGDQWLLTVSPHGPVEYFIGDVDFEACRFQWQKRGYVDRSTNFYATNILEDSQGRQLLWGAVEGFQHTSGWNGINSLPRKIQISDGKLSQQPPKELQNLRQGQATSLPSDGVLEFDVGTFEIALEVQGDASITIMGEAAAIEISAGNNAIRLGDYNVPVNLSDPVRLRIFLDVSVVELFIGENECVTLVTPPISKGALQLHGGCTQCKIWKLKNRGLFSYWEDKA